MVTTSIIKNLLCDDDSLTDYYNKRIVSEEDVKRRLFLLERNNNRNIPDHYYILNRENSLNKIDTLAQILRLGLGRLAGDHLELKNKRIYVLQEKQNDWQQLIILITPLTLQSAFLQRNKGINLSSTDDIRKYFHEYIYPNFRHTALPCPYIPQIEHYIRDKNGLHDLHMHLSGTTETDITWQDFLFEPEKTYNELEKEFASNRMVKEQFEQETHFAKPNDIYNLFRIAQRLRNFFFIVLFPKTIEQDKKDWLKNSNNKIILKEVLDLDSNEIFNGSIYHPFLKLTTDSDYNQDQLIATEALMNVLILQYLSQENAPSIVASMYHFYLLILGLTNRLLVQQTHQFGFRQFQKVTMNELRSNSERAYRNRFLQLHGNDQRNVNFLEGRFAPKDSLAKNEKLISNIEAGWASLLGGLSTTSHQPVLKLIAHFIKRPEGTPDEEIRHKKLRFDIWNKAIVLAFMKANGSPYIKNVIGVDAASSEFDAPTEIFAPAFRMLRRKGFNHFTYHAGEDFYHIISGLRAIYEAIDFNELEHGDRIGHATAAGVSANTWIRDIGNKILVRKGEYLDDLVFCHFLILNERIAELKPILPYLVNKINELNQEIYKKAYSLKTIEEAWLMRKYCPSMILSETLSDSEAWKRFIEHIPIIHASKNTTFDFDEWCDTRKNILQKANSESINLFKKYHHSFYRNEYEKIIEIDIEEFFDINAIEVLQKSVLKFMHKKEIVIETLPTSNIRIGHHHNYGTYHLWNWVKWEDEGYSIPPIVVGTDDAGIFATNIYNEYANIYCYLTSECKMNHNRAIQLVERLDKNARIYRFD